MGLQRAVLIFKVFQGLNTYYVYSTAYEVKDLVPVAYVATIDGLSATRGSGLEGLN